MLAADAKWRHVGDEPADALVRRLAEREEIWPVNALLRDARINGAPLPDVLPDDVRAFFALHARLPSFADPTRLARAAVFADAHLPFLSVSLLAASMPMLFAGMKGARVLGETRRLLDDVDRRVNETGRYVLDVVAHDGFSPRGASIVSTLKVRLVHAAVRHEVAVRRAAANLAVDEVLINQQDMAATLLAFSIVALRSMERLGVRATPREREDYYHLWRVAGVMMGVDPTLVPTTVRDAEDLLTAFNDILIEPSDHGRELTATLIEGMERHVPAPMRDMPRRLVRHLVGDRIADALAVPAPATSARRFTRIADLVARSAPDLVKTLSPMFARALHEAIVQKKLAGRDSSFPMPMSTRGVD